MAGDRDEHWVSVALEEYRTLRQEALAAIEQMQRTLQIGLVAIGVLTAFGVDAVNEGAGVQAGLAIATPVLAALVVALRLDELYRAVNAGAQVAVIEQKIARRFPGDEPPLTWETGVQEGFKPEDDRIRHGAITVILFAATAPAVLLGTIEFGRGQGAAWLLVAAGVALVVLLTFAYQRSVLKRVKKRHFDALHKIREPQPAA